MQMRHVVTLCVVLGGCALDSGDGGASGTGGTGGTSGDSGTEICTLPFDSGPCDAAFLVWAFVPELGACFPHTWGGCGGNANNFASRAECEAACPSPTQACPPNRIPTTICLQCGVPGGCAESTETCALICSGSDQCSNTTAGPIGCFEGVCQVGGCI